MPDTVTVNAMSSSDALKAVAECENAFGRFLKSARHRMGWTLKQASHKAGVSVPVISCAERGDRRLGRAAVLAVSKIYPESHALLALWLWDKLEREARGFPDQDFVFDLLSEILESGVGDA